VNLVFKTETRKSDRKKNLWRKVVHLYSNFLITRYKNARGLFRTDLHARERLAGGSCAFSWEMGFPQAIPVGEEFRVLPVLAVQQRVDVRTCVQEVQAGV
jgi:hypothetical protein